MFKARRDFWRNAARSLPPQVQARYGSYFEAAERWELAWDRVVELGARIKRLGRRPQANPA
jgi:hypothetical protein